MCGIMNCIQLQPFNADGSISKGLVLSLQAEFQLAGL